MFIISINCIPKRTEKDIHLRIHVRYAIRYYVKINFLFSISICPLYLNMRQRPLNPILIDNPKFSNLSNFDQIIYLMQFYQYDIMSYKQSA